MDRIRSWYRNIGAKIKTWAIWIFIIEALATIIAGFVVCGIFLTWDDGYLWAFLSILAIPLAILIEFVSTWLLYAFGELVEKTCEIARNTYSLGGQYDKTFANHRKQSSSKHLEITPTFDIE